MSDEIKFSASARIPTRPLSYENKNLAEKKELVVDYENHKVYISDVNGNLIDITESLKINFNELEKLLKEKPEIYIYNDCTLPPFSNSKWHSGGGDGMSSHINYKLLLENISLEDSDIVIVNIKLEPEFSAEGCGNNHLIAYNANRLIGHFYKEADNQSFIEFIAYGGRSTADCELKLDVIIIRNSSSII